LCLFSIITNLTVLYIPKKYFRKNCTRNKHITERIHTRNQDNNKTISKTRIKRF